MMYYIFQTATDGVLTQAHVTTDRFGLAHTNFSLTNLLHNITTAEMEGLTVTAQHQYMVSSLKNIVISFDKVYQSRLLVYIKRMTPNYGLSFTAAVLLFISLPFQT